MTNDQKKAARLRNFCKTGIVPRTEIGWARSRGVAGTPTGHHEAERPTRKRLAHCIGF